MKYKLYQKVNTPGKAWCNRQHLLSVLFALLVLFYGLPHNVTAQQDTCVTPPSGMTAWYPLDEQNGATQVNDIAGFNNWGTPQPGGSVGPPNGP